jgi:ABC-2 type transport system permease protein
MMTAYWNCLRGIVTRDVLRFLKQRERLVAALVRPVLWLLVFAAGLRGTLEIEVSAPYHNYAALDQVAYGLYILPGLVAMVLLFNGMQSSLSMVYDRELGSLRLLLISPLPRTWLLLCKLLAGVSLGLVQVYCFLLVAGLFGFTLPPWSYIAILPALIISSLLFGAIGLLLSSLIRQLENFAGVMNFVIFPLFFLSGALYPLENFQHSSQLLYWLGFFNPFNQVVEMLRFACYCQFNGFASGYSLAAMLLFLAAARRSYCPESGLKKMIK